MDEARRLSTEEFHLVAQLLALSVSPRWQRAVLRVMTMTGSGQEAKATAVLWRLLPEEEWECLEAALIRLLPPSERRRL